MVLSRYPGTIAVDAQIIISKSVPYTKLIICICYDIKGYRKLFGRIAQNELKDHDQASTAATEPIPSE